MLDIIGGIFAGALSATLVAALAGRPSTAPIRPAIVAAAMAWTTTVLAAAALGAFDPGALGPVPPGVLPFAILSAALIGAWVVAPRFRAALLAAPLSLLVALHAGRLGGVFFLLLQADGRLSAPFAPFAAWGDMATAAMALLLAVLLVRGVWVRPTLLLAWNAFGALDLVLAVTLGLLSAPGTPFRLFSDGPGLQALTGLPWVLVPALLVPIYLLLHLAIAVKLQAVVRQGRPSWA